MRIAYIDSQNIKLWVRGLGREIDRAKFYEYLKRRYKIDEVKYFVGYLSTNHNYYETLRSIWYQVILKSTYEWEWKVKWNVDTRIMQHGLEDFHNWLLTGWFLLSWDGDFDILVQYRKRNWVFSKLFIPSIKKFSKLLERCTQSNELVYLEDLSSQFLYKKNHSHPFEQKWQWSSYPSKCTNFTHGDASSIIKNTENASKNNNPKVSVLHISIYPEKWKTYTAKSGVASYLKNLITSKKSEYTLTVLCDQENGYEEYKEQNISIIRWRRVWIKSFRDIIKFLCKYNNKHQIIHIQHELHFRWSTIVGYLILVLPIFFRNNKRILTSHHAIDFTNIDKNFIRNHGQKLPIWFVKIAFQVLYFFYRFQDIIIVHEGIHRFRLSSQYHLREKNITVIPHWVEFINPLSKEVSKSYLWIKKNIKVIFTMGYVTGYKDLAVLIEWYADWVQNNLDSILLIWAWPEKKSLNNIEYMRYYKSLQDLAVRLIPKENYRRLGFISSEDLPHYYSACDIVVLPYRYTLSASGPMAIAIAYKKPFLASRCFEDYFTDFQDCIFDMDKHSLSQSIERFYNQKDTFQTFVEKLGKERSYSKCLDKTKEVYSKVILNNEK